MSPKENGFIRAKQWEVWGYYELIRVFISHQKEVFEHCFGILIALEPEYGIVEFHCFHFFFHQALNFHHWFTESNLMTTQKWHAWVVSWTQRGVSTILYHLVKMQSTINLDAQVSVNGHWEERLHHHVCLSTPSGS